jgi:hypothetical protein
MIKLPCKLPYDNDESCQSTMNPRAHGSDATQTGHTGGSRKRLALDGGSRSKPKPCACLHPTLLYTLRVSSVDVSIRSGLSDGVLRGADGSSAAQNSSSEIFLSALVSMR